MLGKKTGGRQKGSKNRATRLREQKLAEALIADQLTPEQAASLTSLPALRHILRRELMAGDFAGAKVTANMIAPYENARLSSSDVRITGSLDSKSDADIAAELAELQAKLAAAGRVVSFPVPRLIHGDAEPVDEADLPRWRDEVI